MIDEKARGGPYALAIIARARSLGRRAERLGPIAQHVVQAVLPVAPVPSALRYSVATGGSLDKCPDRDTDCRDSHTHGDARCHDVEYLLVAPPAQGHLSPVREPADLGPAELSVRPRKEYRRAQRPR
jgi:hypothetical protein